MRDRDGHVLQVGCDAVVAVSCNDYGVRVSVYVLRYMMGASNQHEEKEGMQCLHEKLS